MLNETEIKRRLKGIRNLGDVVSYHEGEFHDESVEVVTAEIRRGADLEERTYVRNSSPCFEKSSPRLAGMLVGEYGLNGRDFETAKGYHLEGIKEDVEDIFGRQISAGFERAVAQTRETNNILCLIKYLAETADEHEVQGAGALQTDDFIGAGYHTRKAHRIYRVLERIAPAAYKNKFSNLAKRAFSEIGQVPLMTMDTLYAP